MQVPDLSRVSPQAPSWPYAAPVAPPPADSPGMERTLPTPLPDFSAPPPAAGPELAPPAPSYIPDAACEMEPAETPGAAPPAPKSKLIPALIGGVVAVMLAAAALVGYWKFHQTRIAPAPPAQGAVQTPPVVTPPPVPTPEAPPTPPPAPTVAQPATPVSAAPGVARKTTLHKPKQVAPQPAAPAPAPPPQPAPVVAVPPPVPAPSTPSPEEIAKAEAARLAKIPRIVQVLCNFGLKEGMLIFSADGNPLFGESLKGKKVKGGFLGIKGSYQGTLTRTITVPAGMSDISIRVTSKDGATDLTKAIKLPPPGGFVPTLSVEVDNEHLSLSWKVSSSAK